MNCKADKCSNKAVARGLCKKHWQRLRRHGDAEIVLKKILPETCEVIGCARKPHARWKGKAVCNMHYLRLLTHGTEEEREKEEADGPKAN